MPASTGYYDEDILCDSDDEAAAMGLLSLNDGDNDNSNSNSNARGKEMDNAKSGRGKGKGNNKGKSPGKSKSTSTSTSTAKTNNNIDLFAQADFLSQSKVAAKNKKSTSSNKRNGRKSAKTNDRGTSTSDTTIHNTNTFGVHVESPENDLLGLTSAPPPPITTNTASIDVTSHDIFMTANATEVKLQANQELLGLEYNYNFDTTPTADLLGFTATPSCSFDSSSQINIINNTNNNGDHSSSTTNKPPQSSDVVDDELLTLDYTPPPPIETESTKASMKMNDAYSALEQMRVANLEIDFSNYNKKCQEHLQNLNSKKTPSKKKIFHKNIKFDRYKCVQCQRMEFTAIEGIDSDKLFGAGSIIAKVLKQNQTSPTKAKKAAAAGINTPSAFKSFRFKNDKPCLMCGSPTCKKHSDPGFLKTKIAICVECSPLFSLDFIVDCVTLNNAADEDDDEEKNGNSNDNDGAADEDIYFSIDTTGSGSSFECDDHADDHADDDAYEKKKQLQQERRRNDTTVFSPHDIPRPVKLSAQEQLRQDNIKHMVDVYDRVHLMLTYSAQFIDEIAAKLETNTKREDRVGLSSNSIGIASGLAGIAAAAAVVTPAGPPLIIASLLFGATAQASSSGSKLVNYYSAPNKVALKIISYYNLLKSILVVTNVLRDALLKDHINLEQYVSKMVKAHDEAMIQLDAGYGEEKQQSTTSKEMNDEIDFEEDWETDDDSTVVSMRSRTSNIPKTLGGIKEESEEESFGEFQMADSIDSNSVASWVVSPRSSPPNKQFSPPKVKSPEEPKVEVDEALMDRKTTAGKLARFYSRSSLAGSSLVGAATVTVFAGAALSLAHVAFEANNFASTLKKIQAGSPSKRAQVLRNIKEDIQNLPKTSIIAEEWENYLSVLEERRKSRKKNILSESFDSDTGIKDYDKNKTQKVDEEEKADDLD